MKNTLKSIFYDPYNDFYLNSQINYFEGIENFSLIHKKNKQKLYDW